MENRQAILYGPNDLRIEEAPTPVPSAREVLLRVEAVGVCGSDTHYHRHGRAGRFIVQSPLVLGHEASGVIVALGSQTRHRIGGRVAIQPGVPCGQCRVCRTGRYNLCPEMRFMATPPVNGAFARYVAINEDFGYPIPDSMTAEEAAWSSLCRWVSGRASVRVCSRATGS